MIILFSLLCPFGHLVGGQPHAYPGSEPPPEKWMDNISQVMLRDMRSDRTSWTCPECACPLDKTSGVQAQVMKAQTMEQAVIDLANATKPSETLPVT